METTFFKFVTFVVVVASMPVMLCSFVNYSVSNYSLAQNGKNHLQVLDYSTGADKDDMFESSPKTMMNQISENAFTQRNISVVNRDTIGNSDCDNCLPLVRIEGTGNGMNVLEISPSTENQILNEPYFSPQATYLFDGAPLQVRVIDPFHLPECEFELSLYDSSGLFNAEEMFWKLENLTTGQVDYSIGAFSTISEDLLLDYGLSISWGQYVYLNEDGLAVQHKTDLLDSEIEFADPANRWLTGIPDEDGFTELNWIRAGSVESTDTTPEEEAIYDDYRDGSGGDPFTDASETFEEVLDGTWSPYCLTGYTAALADSTLMNIAAPTTEALSGDLSPALMFGNISNIKGLNNVDIVFTSDKSKWTRCVVLEMQPIADIANDQFSGQYGEPEKMKCRRHKSVDKNGRTSDDAGYNAEEGDLISPWGMGWFPGYVIDVGTAERLNVAFGENSWLVSENGNDMIFNPTNRLLGLDGQALFGGQHWIYVFKNIRAETFRSFDSTASAYGADIEYCPAYDEGAFLFERLSDDSISAGDLKKVYRGCTWVGSTLSNPDIVGQINGTAFLTPEEGLIPSSCRIRLRVAKPYEKANPSGGAQDAEGSLNGWRSLYRFSTVGITVSCPSLSPSLQEGLVGYWPFCGNANDESGNGNHGLVNGAMPVEDRFGTESAAYAFNGLNSFISVVDNVDGSLDVQAGEFSISCWMKAESNFFQTQGLVSKEYGDNASGDYSLVIPTNGKAQLSVGVGSGIIGAVQQSDSVITDGGWKHITAVYVSGNDMRIYINGQLNQGENNESMALPNSNTALDLIFGRSANFPNYYFLNGCLDDVAIWNRALSSAEVQQLYSLDAIGVESLSKTKALLTYPNPSSDQLTINYGDFASVAGYRLSIFDNGGSAVYETQITQAQEALDISKWSAGVYHVVLLNAGGVPVETRQIVIQ
jgi:hypothetical protein